MSQERLTEITPESQDLINKVYPKADAGRLQEWLVGSTHGQSLIGELEKNTHDVKNAGISRLGILVEVCANYHFRKDYKQDDRLPPDVRTKLGMQILETAARRALPKDAEERAVSNKMSEIYNEGVEEVEVAKGVNVFQIKEPAVTALAEVVEEVVGEWVANESLQAQLRTINLKYQAREQALRNANQRAAEAEKKGGGEVWDNVLHKAAQERYDKLDQQAEKPKVDALAAALLDCVPGEPLAKEVVSLLDDLFKYKLIDRVMGSSGWMKKSSLGGKDLSEETVLVEAFQNLLRMKELPGSKNKNRETELIANMAFYKEMGGVVRLRIEQIREERKFKAEKERKIADLTVQAKAVELGLGKFTGEDAEVITKIKQAADDLGCSLPDMTKKINIADELAVFFPQIKLKFKKGWKVAETEIGCTILSDLGSLAYFMDMRKLQEKGMFELKENFMLGTVLGDETKQRVGLYQDSILVAEIKAGQKPDVIIVSWQNNLDFGLGLQASRIVGQALIDYVNKKGVIKNDFPEITLKKGSVATEAVTESPVSKPAAEKAEENPMGAVKPPVAQATVEKPQPVVTSEPMAEVKSKPGQLDA